MKKFIRSKRIVMMAMLVTVFTMMFGTTAMAASPTTPGNGGGGGGQTADVAKAVEDTWNSASGQIKTVVNNVVFPCVDLILAVFFFVKLGMCYFDYRKHGQFDWTPPAILFACLVFMLTAPLYIWGILGM